MSFGPLEDIHARDYSRPTTDVKEVWFAGCHSGPLFNFKDVDVLQIMLTTLLLQDVGGRLYENTGPSLSDPSFGWMCNQIFASNIPIRFKKEAFDNLKSFTVVENRRPSSLGSVLNSHGSRSVVQKIKQKESNSGARAEMRDQLKRSVFWWIVELIPFLRSTWKGGNVPWEERR